MVSINRHQRISLGNGVPQSLIFSHPIFKFLLEVITEFKMFLYADDSLLLSQHTNYSGAASLLQRDATNMINSIIQAPFE